MTGVIGELVWVLTASHHRAMFFHGRSGQVQSEEMCFRPMDFVKEALIFRAFSKLSVNSQCLQLWPNQAWFLQCI